MYLQHTCNRTQQLDSCTVMATFSSVKTRLEKCSSRVIEPCFSVIVVQFLRLHFVVYYIKLKIFYHIWMINVYLRHTNISAEVSIRSEFRLSAKAYSL